MNKVCEGVRHGCDGKVGTIRARRRPRGVYLSGPFRFLSALNINFSFNNLKNEQHNGETTRTDDDPGHLATCMAGLLHANTKQDKGNRRLPRLSHAHRNLPVCLLLAGRHVPVQLYAGWVYCNCRELCLGWWGSVGRTNGRVGGISCLTLLWTWSRVSVSIFRLGREITQWAYECK